MKSGKCPKCSSDRIHVISTAARDGSMMPMGLMSHAALDSHVCTNCGYVESYVRDPQKLETIAEKWPLEEQ